MKIKNVLFTVHKMRMFDDWAINIVGVPSSILMENAGRNVAEEVYNDYFSKKRSSYSQVIVFCGIGNNGGDGLVAARHLFLRNVKVKAYVLGGISQLVSDAELNFRILKKMDIDVFPLLSEKDVIKVKLTKDVVIIDAIFGVGLNKEVVGVNKLVIDSINTSKSTVVSVDVPSGLDIDTGTELGVCVKANKTVTFVQSKTGFKSKFAKKIVGKVVIRDVGIVHNKNRK